MARITPRGNHEHIPPPAPRTFLRELTPLYTKAVTKPSLAGCIISEENDDIRTRRAGRTLNLSAHAFHRRPQFAARACAVFSSLTAKKKALSVSRPGVAIAWRSLA
jgi:hypothetical protein